MCSMGLERGMLFFFSSRRRHTRYWRDWSSDVCSSDLEWPVPPIYVRLTEGLKRSAGLPDAALEIFTSHVTMDVEHARIMMDAVAPYAENRSEESRVGKGWRSRWSPEHYKKKQYMNFAN